MDEVLWELRGLRNDPMVDFVEPFGKLRACYGAPGFVNKVKAYARSVAGLRVSWDFFRR